MERFHKKDVKNFQRIIAKKILDFIERTKTFEASGIKGTIYIKNTIPFLY